MPEKTLEDRVAAVKKSLDRIEKEFPALGTLRQMAMVANETGERSSDIPKLYRGENPDAG